MAIPTTASFDLQVDDLIDAAFARCGGSRSTAGELDSAKRALNLVFQKITNRGVALWQLELATLSLSLNTATYTLDADTVDIFSDPVMRDTSLATPLDLPLTRMSYDVYLSLPNKDVSGRPTMFLIERQLGAPVLRLYQPPNIATFRLTYWRIKKPRDAAAFSDQVDYPARWQGALISGLAYFMALDRPTSVPPDLRALLKAQWEEDYGEAAGEYVDRTDLIFSADLSCYTRI